jgi:hypothetical protein
VTGAAAHGSARKLSDEQLGNTSASVHGFCTLDAAPESWSMNMATTGTVPLRLNSRLLVTGSGTRPQRARVAVHMGLSRMRVVRKCPRPGRSWKAGPLHGPC